MSKKSERGRGRPPADRSEAYTWLKQRLSNGPTPTTVVRKECMDAGFSERAYEAVIDMPEFVIAQRYRVFWLIDLTVAKLIPADGASSPLGVLHQAASKYIRDSAVEEKKNNERDAFINVAKDCRWQYENKKAPSDVQTFAQAFQWTVDLLEGYNYDELHELFSMDEMKEIATVYGPQDTQAAAKVEQWFSRSTYANGDPATKEKLCDILMELKLEGLTIGESFPVAKAYADKYPAQPPLTIPEIAEAINDVFPDEPAKPAEAGPPPQDTF